MVSGIVVQDQCWYIWQDQLGDASEAAEKIVKIMLRKVGIKYLDPRVAKNSYRWYLSELEHFFIYGLDGASDIENINYAFSVLELMCKQMRRDDYAIDEINKRLRLGGIGYKYIDDLLFPLDDTHIMEACIIPAITLLNSPEFSVAYDYVKKAYSDLRIGNAAFLEGAVDNIQKACETLLKTIFDKLKIEYPNNATFMPLIQIAADQNLLMPKSNDKLNPLLPALTNNIKRLREIRNYSGGHGKTASIITYSMARYAINHAMADMLFIAESYKSLLGNVKSV